MLPLLLHPSQAAQYLGIPRRPAERARLEERCAQLVLLLQSWEQVMGALTVEQLKVPTRSRGRSLLRLAVSFFRSSESLPRGWSSGVFDWEVDEAKDHAIEDAVVEPGDFSRFAEGVIGTWWAFLEEHRAELDDRDPPLATDGEPVRFGDMVDALRFEAAFKYRQLVEHLRSNDIRVPVPLHDVEELTGMRLPEYLYDPDNG